MAALTAADIDRLRTALAEGKPTPVWFTAKAVGVPAGQQAKVIAFDEPAEGDFIQVRPQGSRDVLSFSPGELTTVKPKPVPKPAAPAPVAPTVEPVAVVQGLEGGGEVQGLEGGGEVERPRRGRKQVPVEITVTLHATPEGEWTVDVLVGKKRTVRWVPVPAGEIAKAARFLPAPVGEAIGSALDAARERGQRRVEELKAELEAAQRVLRDLG
ncbi:DUF6319 family protein [Actinokineospora enzanensis]|uniref:DUF6319 family protein n=1 Tax=Actinokineospora enzanensis TaxID=155975 RepID=UPI000362E341|nr:DUF6319 family protein [Actinokineospora enzanensis]